MINNNDDANFYSAYLYMVQWIRLDLYTVERANKTSMILSEALASEALEG